MAMETVTKTDWYRRFKSVGVRRNDIFNEIVRAKKIDQILFSNPVNRVYGVEGSDIVRTMRACTEEEFGRFSGEDEAYLAVFETAMAAPAMWFCPYPNRVHSISGLIAYWRHHAQARRVLLWGAECYLPAVAEIETVFPYAQITVVVDDAEMAIRLGWIYPHIEWFSRDTIPVERRFDYVYVWGDGEDGTAWKQAWEHRDNSGVSCAWWETKEWPVPAVQIDQMHTSYYVQKRRGKRDMVMARWTQTEKHVYGTTVYRNGKWIDTVCSRFEWDSYWDKVDRGPVLKDVLDVVTDCVTNDVSMRSVRAAQVQNRPLCDADFELSDIRKGYALEKGDILLSLDTAGYRVALVSVTGGHILADTGLTVLRPKANVSGWGLFLWLIHPELQNLFIHRQRSSARNLSRWLHMPIPKSAWNNIDESRLEKAFQVYAAALTKWKTECRKIEDKIWETSGELLG